MRTTRSASSSAAALSKQDYVALARFRAALRRFLRFVEAGAREAGLTPQQHQLLLAIRGCPDRDWAAVGDLAASLQVRHHTAVELVDRCASLGFVRRAIEPGDRRRVHVHLTPKGLRKLERLTRRNRSELEGLRRALDVNVLPEPSPLGLDKSERRTRRAVDSGPGEAPGDAGGPTVSNGARRRRTVEVLNENATRGRPRPKS
jgi:DNA-binding MarR family transcriptional regulator